MGDILLKEAARRLSACIRQVDTVARLGGDEFTIILGELDSSKNVERVARSILKTLAEPFRLKIETVYLSASIGVTLYPDDATEIDALLKNADQAMYAAKSQGRNRFNYFTPSMQHAALNLETAIDRLLPALTYCIGKRFYLFARHQFGESATYPIARFSSCPALLLLLVWNGHTASSRLAGQLEKRTLGHVQSPFLG